MAELRRKHSKVFNEGRGIGRGLIYRRRRQSQEEHEAGSRAFPGRDNPRDEVLVDVISSVQEDSRYRYGSPSVTAEFKRRGYRR